LTDAQFFDQRAGLFLERSLEFFRLLA